MCGHSSAETTAKQGQEDTLIFVHLTVKESSTAEYFQKHNGRNNDQNKGDNFQSIVPAANTTANVQKTKVLSLVSVDRVSFFWAAAAAHAEEEEYLDEMRG